MSTVRDLIPYELGGTVDLVLAPEGVRCRLELPTDCLSNDREPASEGHRTFYHREPVKPELSFHQPRKRLASGLASLGT